jgi:hypothetical protein
LEGSCEAGGIKEVERESVSGREMGAAEGGDIEIGNAWSFFRLCRFGCPAVFDCEYVAKKGSEKKYRWQEGC